MIPRTACYAPAQNGTMLRFLLICLGGAVGTGARYLLSGFVLPSTGAGFPLGTLSVNVIGSFLLAVMQYMQEGAFGLGALNMGVTLLACLAAGGLGLALGRWLVGSWIMRVLQGEQVLVRIYIGESDRGHGQPLATALVARLRKEGFAGATVLRDLAGFGARSIVHTSHLLEKVRVLKYGAGPKR